ncbi:recombinase family protein [Halomonas stenophila]|uniref:DNA invertase Pin-like site-specific DNA recombinase n=1 Tax=Halomonas stenophila TaxID=795312 RepID=A0A7W5EVR4_9GAMM|nr:recombinase family protein [Halomonas stenophila]MBB3231922.1 DNA invertase Pin-like site-specific DNA recombinase [Halomonas stenophila]
MSPQIFVRGYLRASTDDQDANRARQVLKRFADEHGARVAAWYTENASGAQADRSELLRLLADSGPGDVLLIEQVDRLTRLARADWESLKVAIQKAGVRIVALDLPTSHAAMRATDGESFTARMLDAVNDMLLDMLAAVARKDYEDRRRRQAEGIENAKARGVYKGRPANNTLHMKVEEIRAKGFSIRKTAELAGCSPSTVQRVLASTENS